MTSFINDRGKKPQGSPVVLTTDVSGVLPVANGGTNASSASITAFNNITGYTASGATGTTSTNLVFSTSPILTTPTLGVASATSINFGQDALNYYDSGTWTPIDSSGAGLTFTAATGVYERIGRQVNARSHVAYPATADGSTAIVGGLPFTSSNADGNPVMRQGFCSTSDVAVVVSVTMRPNATTFDIRKAVTVNATNADMTLGAVFSGVIYHVP